MSIDSLCLAPHCNACDRYHRCLASSIDAARMPYMIYEFTHAENCILQAVAVIVNSFAKSKRRDDKLFRSMSTIVRAMPPSTFDAQVCLRESVRCKDISWMSCAESPSLSWLHCEDVQSRIFACNLVQKIELCTICRYFSTTSRCQGFAIGEDSRISSGMSSAGFSNCIQSQSQDLEFSRRLLPL